MRAVEAASYRLGKALSQAVLAEVVALPGVTSVIIGARNLSQRKENMGTSGSDLISEERNKLDEMSSLPSECPQDFPAWVEPQMHGNIAGH